MSLSIPQKKGAGTITLKQALADLKPKLEALQLKKLKQLQLELRTEECTLHLPLPTSLLCLSLSVWQKEFERCSYPLRLRISTFTEGVFLIVEIFSTLGSTLGEAQGYTPSLVPSNLIALLKKEYQGAAQIHSYRSHKDLLLKLKLPLADSSEHLTAGESIMSE
ncbi:hypothetical protein PZB74_11505 [Porifericola rhodea]|uniref:hypothetical protein n=1 Tax=Porifericola rhodea TaxID=930972 RepID=UPI0026670A7B|nr:hypothetical protein [Porifericola rhodea]WKN29590.1 hypothetical protein PZB74_11505 [Porifericola rhodea]